MGKTIKGSNILITGAAGGIGRALIDALVTAGAHKIYAGARDPSALDDLVKAHPGQVAAIELDVTDGAQIKAAAATAVDVDILINNAGVNHNTPFLAAPDLRTAREEMEANYFAPLAMARAFAPILKSNGGGVLVNMLSITGRVNLPVMASLSASKAAGFSLTQGLRAEMGKNGTTVIGVMPGAVDTRMTADYPGDKIPPSDVAEAIIKAVEAGEEDVYVGPMAAGIAEGLANDPKAVERELASYL